MSFITSSRNQAFSGFATFALARNTRDVSTVRTLAEVESSRNRLVPGCEIQVDGILPAMTHGDVASTPPTDAGSMIPTIRSSPHRLRIRRASAKLPQALSRGQLLA